MKLVTFVLDGQTHIGTQVENEGKTLIVDLNRADSTLPQDMVQFIRGGDALLQVAQKVLKAGMTKYLVPLEEVKLCAPILNPGKIICLGLNYRAHATEGGREVPEFPTLFSKYSNAVAGPYDAVLLPKVSSQVDYEVELACVIGERIKNVSEADALKYVYGYMVMNDVSARDYQWRTSQWLAGKSFDGFAPMGPALVTKDEIPNPGTLDLWLTVNGQERQHSNTSDLIFSIPYLVAYISQIMTLDAGDVISTGTPAGVGAFHKPPVFLKNGDEVVACVDKVGKLVNRFESDSL